MNNLNLREYANSLGYVLPGAMPSNCIARFSAPNKSKANKSAWLYLDSHQKYAAFGDWISCNKYTWVDKDSTNSTYVNKTELNKKIKIAKQKYLDEQNKQHLKAVKVITGQLKYLTSTPCEHEYLRIKDIKSFGIHYLSNIQGLTDVLIIPVYGSIKGFEGIIQSLQLIDGNGNKRFIKGSKIEGGYYIIQEPTFYNDIVICEGFATGATLAMHYTPDAMVICAFNANNLLSVAKYIRNQYPNLNITIAADNDHLNKINIGKEKAQQAASIIGANLSIPKFKSNEDGTDWNDYHHLNNGGLQ